MFLLQQVKFVRNAIIFLVFTARCYASEMDMGWVHPWLGLGWVESHFPAHVMGWVGLNEKYCGIVAEYCKTDTFHYR